MATAVTWAAIISYALLNAIPIGLYAYVFKGLNPGMTLATIPKVAADPLFLLALSMSFAGAFVRLALFDRMGIVRGNVATSLAFVLGLLFLFVFFGQKLQPAHWVGIGLICVGVWMVTT
jgi:drug/metabolite transporter (DMT)-like permease